jgi:hypothetical protein
MRKMASKQRIIIFLLNFIHLQFEFVFYNNVRNYVFGKNEEVMLVIK